LPNGVKKLAELKKARSMRAFVLKAEPLFGDTSHWDKDIAFLEGQFARARFEKELPGRIARMFGWSV
jgi:hypothetical protein